MTVAMGLGGTALPGHGPALGQSPQDAMRITIDSSLACVCRIVYDSVAVVGGADPDRGVASGMQVSRDGLGNLYIAQVFNPQTIQVHDPSGRYVRSIGRGGEGPGEFLGLPRPPVFGRGDTLFVLDWIAGRVSTFTPQGAFVESASLSSGAGRHTALILATGDRWATVSERHVSPGIVRTSIGLVSRDGRVTRSFGEELPPSAPAGWTSAGRRIATGRQGGIWSGRSNQYVLELWDSTGNRALEVVRRAEWFPDWWEWPEGSATERPPLPDLRAIWEDRQGLLWTVTAVADEHWRERRWESGRDGGSTAGAQDDLAYTLIDFVYDSMVEIIDVDNGAVVASARLPYYVRSVFGGGYFWTYWEDENIQPRATIRRLRLERHSGGG